VAPALLAAVLVAPLTVLATLSACSAPFDDDGEAVPPGPLPPAVATESTAIPVVVDTDLGADDLVALAFLLRHPKVRVEAVTIAATGLVGCEDGVPLLADLLVELDEPPLPVACGRDKAGPGGREMPESWRAAAATGSGIPRAWASLPTTSGDAVQLMTRLARRDDGLVVVALGPLTNVADFAQRSPRDYARLAGVHTMAGALSGPLDAGVAEWNAAADPEALEVVLSAPAPVTVVPADAIPNGMPKALHAPVVGAIAFRVQLPKWWDLTTAAALVADPGDVETGRFALDPAEPGRLRRTGDGPVRMVRSLDNASLEQQYALTFAPA
jgi:hypothetical protein